ncbi:MAG: HD domain-containing protein [Eubacteriales bacterium]|nr:HD domain-containing protein [Eubacteriales bacterium]
MDGIQFNRIGAASAPTNENEAVTTLLAKQGELEIMLHNIGGESVVWLTPAKDTSAIEFFFVHEGGVDLALDDGLVSLETGESFTVCGLTRDIPVKLHGDTRILYVTSCPSFASFQRFEESLVALLMRVNEKDHYTYRHSGAVLRFSLALYDAMGEDAPAVARDDLAVAALFHDVGKCFVPVEILQKPGRLEQEELRYILRHPVDSGRMLLQEFGEQIAEIARNHHERMDGSGYPRGLSGEDISFASQIVAVADVFDAMTSDRGYNEVKTSEAAAEELVSLSRQFNQKITLVLKRLVADGTLNKEEHELHEQA